MDFGTGNDEALDKTGGSGFTACVAGIEQEVLSILIINKSQARRENDYLRRVFSQSRRTTFSTSRVLANPIKRARTNQSVSARAEKSRLADQSILRDKSELSWNPHPRTQSLSLRMNAMWSIFSRSICARPVSRPPRRSMALQGWRRRATKSQL